MGRDANEVVRTARGDAVADCDPSAHGALFPNLIGAAWERLPASVRRLHGGESPQARGDVRVEGDTHWLARAMRKIARLPPPAGRARLELEIRAHTGGEDWQRRFGRTPMRSALRASARYAHALEERLGPARLTFGFEVVDARLHWIAREVRVLGITLPLRWFDGLRASCGDDQGRYAFDIDVRLPLVGRLVAYSGWLEPLDGRG